mmetsp:Transcript_50069/g.74351  ORF Transcript_50069/g.74351 Transcript_50069/m.74351 type:complete len:229 (+) Transcript_50069:257-943(+)
MGRGSKPSTKRKTQRLPKTSRNLPRPQLLRRRTRRPVRTLQVLPLPRRRRRRRPQTLRRRWNPRRRLTRRPPNLNPMSSRLQLMNSRASSTSYAMVAPSHRRKLVTSWSDPSRCSIMNHPCSTSTGRTLTSPRRASPRSRRRPLKRRRALQGAATRKRPTPTKVTRRWIRISISMRETFNPAPALAARRSPRKVVWRMSPRVVMTILSSEAMFAGLRLSVTPTDSCAT